MQSYLDLINLVIKHGTRKENRTGVDTFSYFGAMFRHDLQLGFPLLTTKRMNWRSIVHELLWILSGETNIQYLLDNDVHIWDEWSDQAEWIRLDDERDGACTAYLLPTKSSDNWIGKAKYNSREDALTQLKAVGYRLHTKSLLVKGKGDTDSGYGRWWRKFPTDKPGVVFDQVAWAIAELKRNPNSRRVVISAWNPPFATQAKLPPCHYSFVLNIQNIKRKQCPACKGIYALDDNYACPHLASSATIPELITRPELCCHWTQRSCDLGLGVPFDIAEYALLTHIIARELGIAPGLLCGSLLDLHIYTKKLDGSNADYDHLPALKEQLTRCPFTLPDIFISGPRRWNELRFEDFELRNYTCHPSLKMHVAV